MNFDDTDYNDFMREEIMFESRPNSKYYRIIEIHCNNMKEEQKNAEVKHGSGVNGIGRIFMYQYNLKKDEIQAYTLSEGEIKKSELDGFGRFLACYGHSHSVTTGYFTNGKLVESQHFEKREYGEGEGLN